MPTLESDLSEGLQLNLRDGEILNFTRTYFAKDLEGSNSIEVLASALNLDDIPAPDEPITIFGRTTYPTDYSVEPVGSNDAIVRVTYTERNLAIGAIGEFGLCTVSGGTSLRQIETDFDAAEMVKPFLERTPIFVSYAANSGAGGTSVTQGGRVPMYLPESSITFTRFERTYPGGRNRLYAGKRNAVEYEGCAVGTLLMWAVTFDQIRSSLYQVHYTIVYDPYTFWNQVLRYIDPTTGLPPKLTKEQLAAQNGIREIVTQQSIAFQGLNLIIG